MKKFEIINGKWIKTAKGRTDNRVGSTTDICSALKISSISKIYVSAVEIKGELHYYIIFQVVSDNDMVIVYEKSEESEFKDDLQFFENLLYKN
jgi:hypothetical protein